MELLKNDTLAIRVLVARCLWRGTIRQQFRISDYDGGNITIEYPPSFAGAYLFVEQSTNLATGAWDVADYLQVSMEEGAQVVYSPVAESAAPDSTNQPIEAPFFITPEYIEAVANGEIVNSEWTANTSTPAPASEGDSWFGRISAVSFVDSDNDGVDNVTEYALNSNPYSNDAPVVALPADDGDPRPVPGSVDSAPGDWNTPPQKEFRVMNRVSESINLLILAMDGTNGTFTAQTPVGELGEWVRLMCGDWYEPENGDTYPTVFFGRFFRTETNGFEWAGQEHVYPLGLYDYAAYFPGGQSQFVNHLVQWSASDRPGLATLPDGSPVLVNPSHPWTEAKIRACLEQMRTIVCRLQRTVAGTFDATDTYAMARAYLNDGDDAETPTPFYHLPQQTLETYWKYDSSTSEWKPTLFNQHEFTWYTQNERFDFADNLASLGFGPTVHRGYVRMASATGWSVGYPTATNAYKLTFPVANPPGIQASRINKMFTRMDNESAWLVAGGTNYATSAYKIDDPPFLSDAAQLTGYILHHDAGGFFANSHFPFYPYYYSAYPYDYTPDDYTVLSTLSPPPLPPPEALTMDCDRDGTIGTNDLARFDQTHPYRFWVNEDGNEAQYDEANMEDFFPALIKGSASNQTFRLSANIKLDYIETTMTASNSMEYLHDIDLAQTLGDPARIQSLNAGTQTPFTFSESNIVLLAAAEINTNAEIYVHILEGGTEVAVSTNYFSFSSVTNMYRTKNLRAGGISFLDEPTNWLDDLTNGKEFVFVHGYNVTESAGVEWNKTIFKRLWLSGSNAKYHALLWDGSPPAPLTWEGGPLPRHYHNAVINALASAPALAGYLNTLNDPVVMAHSLGNMVTSEAITGDHGLPAYKVGQYYAMDAAVALEAYGDSSPNEAMTADNWFDRMDAGLFSDWIPFWSDIKEYSWNDYPKETWASEWYRLFTNDVNDVRGELTWRHRFADIQTKTDVFNFYSSSEEVLRIDTNQVTFISARSSTYVWQIQEHFKGRNNSSLLTSLYDWVGGASSSTCGWRFNEKASSMHIVNWGPIEWCPVRPRTLEEKLSVNSPERAATRAALQTDPLFRPEPEELFEAGAAAFVAGTIATNGANLDYNTSNATYPINDLLVRDWLLAPKRSADNFPTENSDKGAVYAFPSRTRPMGSTPISPQVSTEWQKATFDMHVKCKNPSSGLPSGANHDEWYHNDINKAPYLYVHRLFDQITGKEVAK